jgi:pyruvate kinase
MPENWKAYVKGQSAALGLEGNLAILTEGPSPRHPETNYSMEIIELAP